MKKANGRLHPRLFGTFVCCNGTAPSVLSRGVVGRNHTRPTTYSAPLLDPTMVGAREQRQVTIGEGFFNDAEDAGAGGHH